MESGRVVRFLRSFVRLDARSSLRRALPLLALSLASVLALESRADAFCRTTTCDPGAGEDCRANESGCVRDGVPVIWKTMPIVYRFHAGGSGKLENSAARAAIRRAFEAWANAECEGGRTSLRFREGPEIERDKPLGSKEASEKFGIFFRDDEWPHASSIESLALTNQVYGNITGTIDYADIEINTAEVDFELGDEDKGGIDLQAVITHEVGHYIGLAHSLDEDSIMVASYCQNSTTRCTGSLERKRALADDDIRAVCAVYAPLRRTVQPSRGACAGAPLGPLAGDWVDAGALAVVVASFVRRRRHG